MKYFISYTTRTENNRCWAKWVEWLLRTLGHETIMQEYDFLPGSSFIELMDKALIDSDYVIGILSTEYLQSTNCTREWVNSYTQDKFIPIRFDDCNPKGLLNTAIYIDLYNKDSKSAKEELIKRLTKPLRPLTAPYLPVFTPKAPEPEYPIWEDTEAAHKERLDYIDNFNKTHAALYKKEKQKRSLKAETIVTLDKDRYYIADKAILGDATYFLANKRGKKDDPTDESVIFEEINEDGSVYLNEVEDKDLVNKLVAIFAINFLKAVGEL